MPGPAVLQPYDPAWPRRAARLLSAVQDAMTPLGVGESFEHIGSTSVPGLTAKAFVDLQVTVGELPLPQVLDEVLAPTGFVPTTGSRPDSPGVHRDLPRGSEVVPEEVWRKRLFVHDLDGPGAAILHLRLSRSPWARYTVWFRDWLRAHPEARNRYAAFKSGWRPSTPVTPTTTTTPGPRRCSSTRCRTSSRRGDVDADAPADLRGPSGHRRLPGGSAGRPRRRRAATLVVHTSLSALPDGCCPCGNWSTSPPAGSRSTRRG